VLGRRLLGALRLVTRRHQALDVVEVRAQGTEEPAPEHQPSLDL